MTLNDIKKNALALMFTNYEHDLATEDVDRITDPDYSKYLVNMNAVINRALGRIQQSGVLAVKRFEITTSTAGTTSNGRTRYDLASLISDFLSIARIVIDSEYEYQPTVNYTMEGDVLVVGMLADSSEKYIVLYRRKPSRVSITAASDTVIDVPDDIAELIPYFIKSELYEEDEPEIAVQARNIFEAGLDTFKKDEYCAQTSVKDVYRGLV